MKKCILICIIYLNPTEKKEGKSVRKAFTLHKAWRHIDVRASSFKFIHRCSDIIWALAADEWMMEADEAWNPVRLSSGGSAGKNGINHLKGSKASRNTWSCDCRCIPPPNSSQQCSCTSAQQLRCMFLQTDGQQNTLLPQTRRRSWRSMTISMFGFDTVKTL